MFDCWRSFQDDGQSESADSGRRSVRAVDSGGVGRAGREWLLRPVSLRLRAREALAPVGGDAGADSIVWMLAERELWEGRFEPSQVWGAERTSALSVLVQPDAAGDEPAFVGLWAGVQEMDGGLSEFLGRSARSRTSAECRVSIAGRAGDLDANERALGTGRGNQEKEILAF